MLEFSIAAGFTDDMQIIVIILIGVVYAFGTVLKKVNEWIQKRSAMHRQPSTAARPPASQTEARTAAPGGEKTPDQPRRTIQTTLMRELEKALKGMNRAGEEEEKPEPPPLSAPAPLETAPPPLREETAPSALDEEDAYSEFQEAPLFHSESDGTRVTSTGIKIQAAATVARSRMDHLAVLRTPEDLNRAILLHEILSPPRAMRPLRANSSFRPPV